jgi:hypothetical protein
LSCGVTYQANVPCGCEEIILLSDLADGDYFITITDKFGKVYSQTCTCLDGELPVDLTGFPEGLFTPYSGIFLLEVKDEDSQIVSPEICGSEYESVSISFQQYDDVPQSFNIGCQVPIYP